MAKIWAKNAQTPFPQAYGQGSVDATKTTIPDLMVKEHAALV
jgi:hypothetical protein